ncbi:hypothetical protein OROGR_007935 [Orobanche gracilis]
MPSPRKRSPRAVKRKRKRPSTLVDEFFEVSSQIRHMFFPNMKSAIDPTKDAGNGSFYYYPGRIWLDTDGNPIQAHGGGIMYDERSRTYYWYGEYKDGPTYHAHKKGASRIIGRNHFESLAKPYIGKQTSSMDAVEKDCISSFFTVFLCLWVTSADCPTRVIVTYLLYY